MTKNNFDSEFAQRRIRFYALHRYLQMNAFYEAINEMNDEILEHVSEELKDMINVETVKKNINIKGRMSLNIYRLLCDFLRIPKCSQLGEEEYINNFDSWYCEYKNKNPKKIYKYFQDNVPKEMFEYPISRNNYEKTELKEQRLKKQMSLYSKSMLNLFYHDMEFLVDTMDDKEFSFVYCYTMLNGKGRELVGELMSELYQSMDSDRKKYKDDIIIYYKTALKQKKNSDYIEYDLNEIQQMILEKINHSNYGLYYGYSLCLKESISMYEKIDRECISQLIIFRQYYKSLLAESKEVEDDIKQILYFINTLTMIPSTCR